MTLVLWCRHHLPSKFIALICNTAAAEAVLRAVRWAAVAAMTAAVLLYGEVHR